MIDDRAVMILGAALVLGWITSSWAAPDPDAEYTPAQRQWFHGLKTPDGRLSCCDLSDCREVANERRGRDGGLEVYVDRERNWIPVPESAVLHGVNNIVGPPIICYVRDHGGRTMDYTVFCYVPGFGA
jgi:hypothetical protein